MKKKHKVTDRVWDRERDRDLEREGEEAREREQGVWAGDASSSFAILLKREKVMGMGHTLARLQRERNAFLVGFERHGGVRRHSRSEGSGDQG